MNKSLKYRDLTGKVIRAFYNVYNELGSGFLESVYENAMYLILSEDSGLAFQQQYPVVVYFRNEPIGNFKADLLIEDRIIIELKAVAQILPGHEAQLINYLKATKKEIGLLMNFGDKPEFKRFIFKNKSVSIRADPWIYMPVNTIFPVFLFSDIR